MLQHRTLKTIAITLTGATLVLTCGPAFARGFERSHRDRSYRDAPYHGSYRSHPYRETHYPHGQVQLALANGFFSIFVGSGRYYVSDGIYYHRQRHGYVVVEPPVGAVIRELPDYYRVVMIHGVPYYTNDGIYYQRTPQGYLVVEQPAVTPIIVNTAPLPAPIIAAQPAPLKTPEAAYTVNLPDNKGGYSSVVITRSGNGFKGPQGEFYAEFPQDEQLRAMAAKNVSPL